MNILDGPEHIVCSCEADAGIILDPVVDLFQMIRRHTRQISLTEGNIAKNMLLYFFDTAGVAGGCLFFSIYAFRLSNDSSIPQFL